MVQWLRLCASNGEGTGSIPGRGTKIPHATWRSQNFFKFLKKIHNTDALNADEDVENQQHLLLVGM